MRRKLLIILTSLLALAGIIFVLASEHTLVFHPKGMIASEIKNLIIRNLLIMSLIIIPTYLLLVAVVWKYCIKKKKIKYDPEHSSSPIGELLLWGLPSLIVVALSIVTWDVTHKLNPYKPIESEIPPLAVQVVAIDWKWLFIYPEQGIATLNAFHLPEKTPVHLRLTADGSPMNSFWIPQLSGQIYAMTGMTTQLHLIADAIGNYKGRAVEINGEGYADMVFGVTSTSQKDFESWVELVKLSPLHLTEDVYKELVKPSVNRSVLLFSEVDPDLYRKIIDKYMYPTVPVL